MVSQVLAQAILSQKGPDIMGSFREGQEFARKGKVRKLSGQVLQSGGGEALEELKGLDPGVAMALGDAIDARSARDLNTFIQNAGVTERMLKSGNNQGALQFAEQHRATVLNRGGSTNQIDSILSLMRANKFPEAMQHLNAFTGAVEQGKLTTVAPGATVIDAQGNEIYKAEAAEGEEKFSDLGKDIIKQRNALGKVSKVIQTNYSKLQNLALEVKKGNRSAVAQLGVSLVKLGDPGSVVKEEELRQAFAAKDGGAALAELMSSGKVEGGVLQSVMVRLDALNPDNINVEDILATGNALVNSALPSWESDYKSMEELLLRIPENKRGSLITKSFRDNANTLLGLVNSTPAITNNPPAVDEVVDENAPQMVDF